MILKETHDKKLILFEPENIKERKFLDEKFPGLIREGLQFYCPNKAKVVQSLYTRIRREKKQIKYTPYIKEVIESSPKLSPLPTTFKYHTQPLPFQDIALRYLYFVGSAGLLLEPGLGKTKVILDFIWLMKFKKSLVVCPKSLLFVWEEENKKHRPELKIYIVKTTDYQEEKKGILDADLIIINYDKAISLEGSLIEVGFDFIGLDEGLIKNHTTERTRSINKLSKRIPHRVIMSGTLVNNGPEDVFAPIRFIEPALIGERITQFKKRYGIVAKGENKFIVGYLDIPEIKSILQSCSIVMRKEEWLPYLPKKEFIKCYVQLSDKQRTYYQQLTSNWLLIDKEENFELEVENQLTAMIKLTQISNGFLYYQENIQEVLGDMFGESLPETKKQTKFFNEQPKVDRLLSLLGNELAGKRSLVWFNMKAELEILEKALVEKGITYLVIAGKEKNIGEKVNRFNNDASIRLLLCQAKSVNYGITLLGRARTQEDDDIGIPFEPKVSDEIFYSLNFSLEVFLQQQDRIHRIGQTETCRYYMILANTSMEKRIAESLEAKLACNQEMLVDISKTTKLLDLENL